MNLPETIYTLDVLFGAFVLLFGISGLLRGLPGELARLLTLVGLLCGICFFYPALTRLAAQQWPDFSTPVIQTVTAAALLLGAILFYVLLRAILQRALKEQIGAFFDRFFGALIGMIFGLLVGLSVLCAVSLLPQERPYEILSEKSVIGSWVCTAMTPWLYPRLMDMPVFKEVGQQEVPAE